MSSKTPPAADKVILDGEPVKFEGDIPQDPRALLGMMNQALEKQGRCLTGFSVDGQDWIEKQPELQADSYNRIEASSNSHKEVFLSLIDAAAIQSAGLPQKCDTYAQDVLSKPWSEVVSECSEFSNKIAPLASMLSLLVDYASRKQPVWQNKANSFLQQAEQALTHFAERAEQADAAGLSEVVKTELKSFIEQSWSWVDQEVRPYFKNQPGQN